jgi:hypothetical protein
MSNYYFWGGINVTPIFWVSLVYVTGFFNEKRVAHEPYTKQSPYKVNFFPVLF